MNKGTEELTKILNSIKGMTTEEYMEMYNSLDDKKGAVNKNVYLGGEIGFDAGDKKD